MFLLQNWRLLTRLVRKKLLVSLVLLLAGTSLFAQDIMLSDFEESTYVWLPGGSWTLTGSAFGTGPAQGALSGQGAVTGYQGSGFADSYNGGDAGTGTLLSPTFTIQRKYIKFLIGGGSYRGEGGYGGETRIDLLVNGQVVQHAAGPGQWENLDWEQWNVSNLLGQTAQIRIVDTATAGWGHLEVDQIVQSDTSLTIGVITPTNQFMNFPVKLGNPYHVVALLVNGLAVQEFNMPLGTTANHDFYAFLDLSAYQNTQMVVRVDAVNGAQMADFIQSSAPLTTTPIYQESLRPIYHYSARRGFVNDPNGMVYYNGEYHLCYQHNPYDVVVGNQNWGNAVSTDLVHWQELPEAIYGDALGQAWSGSSVVDSNNNAGFGANAIVSFYTSAGGHGNNNLMSQGQLFSQSLAYSLDSGRTFIKYTNNPVVPNAVTLSTNVAPASMFVNSHSAGNFSYNAEAITNVDGCLFFPQDQYGDEMDFTGPFSIELFLKTDGNQSGAGIMQLVSQGTDTGQTFRYGIDVNAAGSGGVQFKVANSSLLQTNAVDVTGANYADGQWHYLLAVCDISGGSSGQLRLIIANQDGSQASATNNLPAGLLPLPATNNGNLFLGRYTYSVSQTPRTFLGLIDEVQITAGVVPDTWRIGRVPALDDHPQISGISAETNGVSFQWTGAAATNFLVQWAAQLGNVWQTIATLPSSNSMNKFVDTDAGRLTNLAGFYRLVSQ